MKEKVFNLFKKIIFSFIILYSFNTIGSNFNIIIPINIINVLIITYLGPFGLCGLVFFKYIFM